MRTKELQELKKLHKLIIHNHKKIADDLEWYRLARKETRQIKRTSEDECEGICSKCF